MNTTFMEMPSNLARTDKVETPEAGFGFDQVFGGHGSTGTFVRNSKTKERREALREADQIIEGLEESYRRNLVVLRALTRMTSSP